MFEQYWDDVKWIAASSCRRIRSAVAFSVAFKVLNFIVLAPIAAAVLRYCLAKWGRASVGNFELFSFFTSPVGVVALLGVGALLLASLYLELTGLLRLLSDGGLHWWEAFKGSTRLLPRLIALGLVQLAMYVALAVPFLIGIGLVYLRFWSGKDLNGLIILKPPEFWWGVGFAGTLALAYGAVAVMLFLRQLYAVPAVALEPGTKVREALRSSARRSRGSLWRMASTLAAWAVLQGLLTTVVVGLLHWVLQFILSRGSSSLAVAVPAIGTVLAVQWLAVTALSILANVTFVATVLSLYRRVAPPNVFGEGAPAVQPARRLSLGWRAAGILLGCAALAGVFSLLTLRGLELKEDLEITAHRAGAAKAPENSLAALKQAIADRANWAEIDVQLTSDQKLVVMHDIDLARVGGGNRRVDQATLAEIQALDIGTPVGPKFAGERIPTFEDVLAAAAGKIRLNVELKPHDSSDAPELTRRVIEEIRRAEMVPECRICSQSYESLQLAKQLEPTMDVGYIGATTIGDVTGLDVQFLMVKSNLATRQLVDHARLRGIEIHAWTVNDPALVAPLLDAGVANLITDDPAGMRSRLEEVRALSVPERLILRTGHAIAR